MRTSVEQDSNFIKWVLPSNLLEDVIEYIKTHFDAEEIYGKEALEEWALNNDYIKEE